MTRDQLIASLTIILGLSGATAYSDQVWADTVFCTIPDPKTGLTCQQLSQTPEKDVYYIVEASQFSNPDLWANSHQDPATVRWNVANTQFVLKYDGAEVPREEVGILLGLHNPKSQSEILTTMNTVEWKIQDPNDPTVKGGSTRTFVEDNVGQ